MTTRERNLLVILLIVAGSALTVIAVSAYLDSLTRLDLEFVDLQKRAARTAQVLSSAPDPGSGSEWIGLKDRFFAPGTLPDPLILASRAQAALKSSSLAVVESRVTDTSTTSQWVQYHVEGDIQSWFRFLLLLRGEDPKTLFRSMSFARKEGSTYSITFEVGHAVLP